MTDPYDPEDNGIKGYALGLKAWREICIRRGQIAPDPYDKDEMRWAREGERKPGELDSVREK